MGCDSLAFLLLLTQELHLTKTCKRKRKEKKKKKYPSSCNMLHISTFIIWFLITGSSRRARMTQVKSRALQPARLYWVYCPRLCSGTGTAAPEGFGALNCIPAPPQTPSSSPNPLRMFKILSLNQTSSLTKNTHGPWQRDRASLWIRGLGNAPEELQTTET